MAGESPCCVRTLRLKVKPDGYSWLNRAAIEVSQVWNYSNEISHKAARPYAGSSRWLTAFDLDKLTAGATEFFAHIGADTIQRVNAEFATRRKQFKKPKLRWRTSTGSKRSLGWIPFKEVQLKRQGGSLRFSGKAFRVFERELLEGRQWKCGCFAQDAVGDWWLCLPVERAVSVAPASSDAVGIDLGLADTAATSDGDKLIAGQFYRGIEHKIAQAQRRGHKRQAPQGRPAQVFPTNSRSISTHLHRRCEQPETCKNPDGQIRARCGLGHAQGATAVQGPAGRQMRNCHR
jgi:hypothetical protein